MSGSSNHRRLFSFLWRKKKFKKEKGSRMAWEVIRRVALQPHIIYILMMACFTSPQILLQNASLFIYVLVNHSCFTPLAGRRGTRCRFPGPLLASWSASSWGFPRPLGRWVRQGEAPRLTAWTLPSLRQPEWLWLWEKAVASLHLSSLLYDGGNYAMNSTELTWELNQFTPS